MTSFAALFGLNEQWRNSFELNPEKDAPLLVDIDRRALVVAQWLTVGRIPRAAIYGDYGTGKTHLLRHIEKVLTSQFQPPYPMYQPAFLELAGFGRRSTFYDLHIRVMSVLVDLLQAQLPRLPAHQVAIATEGLNNDIQRAFAGLQNFNLTTEERALFRAWLLGTGPTPSQARKAGFSGRLFDWASATDLVRLWQAVGTLQRMANGRTLLLLVDEGEAFQRVVHPDSLSAIAAGLRSLFDPSNASLGCIFALNLPDVRNSDHPFLRSDIASRLQGMTLKLEALNTPERIKLFVRELWGRLSSLPVPLFDDAALELLSLRLTRFRTIISMGQIPQAVTPTQRDLVQVLTVIGNLAFQWQVSPPIRVEHLRAWMPGGVDGP